MNRNFFRTTAAAAAIALTAGVAVPTAFAGESTLGETGFLQYGVTDGDQTKNTNKADRYLRGSGASAPAGVDREKAEANTTPAQPQNQGRFLRGSGISSGPVDIAK